MKAHLAYLAAALVLGACTPNKGPDTSTSENKPAKTALSSGIRLENMDPSVRPGDDFFAYANGHWLENSEIPADKSSYGGFAILRDEAQEDVMDIIKSSAEGDFAAGSDEQKVGGLYRSYMNMDKRNALGLTPLQGELAKIAEITDYTQLARYFAYANKLGYGQPFAIGQYVDFKQPDSYMILSWQGGLGLPEREYYLKQDDASETIRNQYVAHIRHMLTLAGLPQAAANAEQIMALETRLAKEHMKKEQTRNMVALYNNLEVSALSDLMPNFAWSAYLQEAQLQNLDNIVITQLDYMRALDGIIVDTDIATWQQFLQWGLIQANATRLTAQLDKANFDFNGKVLHGIEQQRPQWRRAVELLNDNVGEIIGKVYVKKHFPPAAKERMMAMIDNLLKAYEVSIKELDWMTAETKRQALDKLAKFTPKIGYPDKWHDYSDLTIDENDLFGNMQRASLVRYQQMLDKQQGPVQKHEWAMTPQTVNAYYNPPMNEIVFPAAILQPPFFDMKADDAANYGGIGAVIGHEIGHGFDDSGSTFDGDGVLRNWWTDADKQEFKQRTSQLVTQYSEFVALPDLHVNGEFTLGENIGDLGGISIALKAYKMSLQGKEAPVLDGFTGEQRVFISFGQIWATLYRDEALRNQVQTDPHSPAPFRANGSVRNVAEFYQAFDVKPTDALYLPPEQRVKIW